MKKLYILGLSAAVALSLSSQSSVATNREIPTRERKKTAEEKQYDKVVEVTPEIKTLFKDHSNPALLKKLCTIVLHACDQSNAQVMQFIDKDSELTEILSAFKLAQEEYCFQPTTPIREGQYHLATHAAKTIKDLIGLNEQRPGSLSCYKLRDLQNALECLGRAYHDENHKVITLVDGDEDLKMFLEMFDQAMTEQQTQRFAFTQVEDDPDDDFQEDAIALPQQPLNPEALFRLMRAQERRERRQTKKLQLLPGAAQSFAYPQQDQQPDPRGSNTQKRRYK